MDFTGKKSSSGCGGRKSCWRWQPWETESPDESEEKSLYSSGGFTCETDPESWRRTGGVEVQLHEETETSITPSDGWEETPTRSVREPQVSERRRRRWSADRDEEQPKSWLQCESVELNQTDGSFINWSVVKYQINHPQFWSLISLRHVLISSSLLCDTNWTSLFVDETLKESTYSYNNVFTEL